MRLSIANYAVLLTALVMMGCGASTTDKNVDAGASMGASGVGGVPGIGGASGIGGTPGVGGASEPDCGSDVVEDGFVEVPASDPGIRYLGRLDFSDPNAPVMAFPAVTIETQFEGDAIDMRLAETAPGGAMRSEYYDVSIDQGAPTKLLTCPEREVYPLARDLAQGTHRVRISKRTEAQVGSASFLGFRVRENTTLQAPDAPLRRLEFVGDSITCGYGDEVSTTDPDSFPFTSTNENALLAYGPVTAAALDADVAVVAASGRGVGQAPRCLNFTIGPLPTPLRQRGIFHATRRMSSSSTWGPTIFPSALPRTSSRRCERACGRHTRTFSRIYGSSTQARR